MSPMRIVLCLTLGIAACTSSAIRPVGQDNVDDSYVLGGGKFDSGAKVIVAAAPRDFGGRVGICAVRVEDEVGAFLDGATSSILDNGRILLNGETVLKGLTSAPTVNFRSNINGAPTSCYLTEAAWTDGPKDLQIVIPSYELRTSRQRTYRFTPGAVPQIIGAPPVTAPTPDAGPKPGQWQRSSS